MKLSIIVPMYNVELYLEECLDSIISFKTDFIEIILIEDGSTDLTPKIAMKYASKYNNIKYFEYENGGLSVARNRGVEKSCGDYIIFLDSDDKINCEELNKLLEFIEHTDAGIDVIMYDADVFVSDELIKTRFLNYKRPTELYDINYTGANALKKMLKCANYNVSACMYAIKRDSLKGLRFHPGILHEDNLFTTQLLLSPNIINVTSKRFNVYNRRIRENSITSVRPTKKHLESYIVVYQILKRDFYSVYKELDLFLVSLLVSISQTAFLKGGSFKVLDYRYSLWAFIEKVRFFGICTYIKSSIKILFPFIPVLFNKLKRLFVISSD